MDCVFQIGEISNFFDIPASTLRFWEESGVLVPPKKPGEPVSGVHCIRLDDYFGYFVL